MDNLANQFSDICVKIAGSVAERIQESAMSLPRNERKRIEEMIENDLPILVFNSLRKTVSLQNAENLKYLEDNSEKFIEMYVDKLLGKN